MTKKIIEIKDYSFDIEELEGSLENVIKLLESLKSQYKNARLKYENDYESSYLELWYSREETDKEYADRLKREEQDKKRQEKYSKDRKNKLIEEAKQYGLKLIEE